VSQHTFFRISVHLAGIAEYAIFVTFFHRTTFPDHAINQITGVRIFTLSRKMLFATVFLANK